MQWLAIDELSNRTVDAAHHAFEFSVIHRVDEGMITLGNQPLTHENSRP